MIPVLGIFQNGVRTGDLKDMPFEMFMFFVWNAIASHAQMHLNGIIIMDEDKLSLAIESCWDIDAWTRLDLQCIRHLNTTVPVEEFFNNHPFRSQMLADGVRPYRADLHAWGVEQGLVYSPPFHEDRLRAALLPKMKAVIKENGIHLRRPDAYTAICRQGRPAYLRPGCRSRTWLPGQDRQT